MREITADDAYHDLAHFAEVESVVVRDVWINVLARLEFYESAISPEHDTISWVPLPWMLLTEEGKHTHLRAPLATPEAIRGIGPKPILRRKLADGREFLIVEHQTRTAMFVIAGTPIDPRPLNNAESIQVAKLRDRAWQLMVQADRIGHVAHAREVPVSDQVPPFGLLTHWLLGAAGPAADKHGPTRPTQWMNRMMSVTTDDDEVLWEVDHEVHKLFRGIEEVLAAAHEVGQAEPAALEIANFLELCLRTPR